MGDEPENGDAPIDIEKVVVPPLTPPVQAVKRITIVPLLGQREVVRTVIAVSLVGTLVAMVAAYSIAFMVGAINTDGLKELLSGMFTPILGVFGAVTGFYYGSHASDSQN